MKYIKTYEGVQPKLQIKKYILLKTTRTDIKYLFIAENVNKDKYIRLYESIDCVIKKVKSPEFASIYLDSEDNENIVYQSDNLEDCLNRLKIMIATEKYNL